MGLQAGVTSFSVGSCPSCAAALETNEGVLFCGACRRALRSMEDLGRELGVPADDPRLLMQLTRPIQPWGACPGCHSGSLLGGVVVGERVAQCDACRAMWIQGEQMSRLASAIHPRARSLRPQGGSGPIASVRPSRNNAAAPTAPAAAPALSTAATGSASVPMGSMELPYDTPAINGYAYPAALVLGLVAHLPLFDLLVFGTFGMALHELGHATAAWLGGFVALPLPFFTAQPSEDRSAVVVLLVAAAIGVVGVHGWRARRWGEVIFAGTAAALQIFLTAMNNPAQAQKWMLWSGLGGEILLSTAAMLTFYQRLPWRWDFWRYPVLAATAPVFVRALLLWTGVANGKAVMPHGSALGDDSMGDVERLVRVYHFTPEGLADGYLALARACALLLAVVYAVRLRMARASTAAAGIPH
jgi:hypothetical protein